MSPHIEIAIDVAAPPSRVSDALTRGSELERWFTERVVDSALEPRRRLRRLSRRASEDFRAKRPWAAGRRTSLTVEFVSDYTPQ